MQLQIHNLGSICFSEVLPAACAARSEMRNGAEVQSSERVEVAARVSPHRSLKKLFAITVTCTNRRLRAINLQRIFKDRDKVFWEAFLATFLARAPRVAHDSAFACNVRRYMSNGVTGYPETPREASNNVSEVCLR